MTLLMDFIDFAMSKPITFGHVWGLYIVWLLSESIDSGSSKNTHKGN